MKIYFSVFGCRANFAEAEAWEAFAKKNEFEITRNEKSSDIIIVNTCTVTKNADLRCLKIVEFYRKINPNAEIIITGCGINTNEGIKKLKNARHKPELEGVVYESNDQKLQFIERDQIQNYLKSKYKDHEKTNYQSDEHLISKTRSFLKVQDGCNNFCTYCIIPTVRGREKSQSIKNIISEINEKEQLGFKEIVLTGIHLSNFGSEKNFKEDLTGLVSSILQETKIERIRFGSLEPRFFDQKFIDLFQDKRLCPHLHLSLQSGSEKVLKTMHRHYTALEYKNMVDLLFEKIPDFNLTTDIIVGFPGETDENFKESLNFVKSIPFSKLHVFPYSKREGTLANGMKNQLTKEVKTKRSLILRKLSDEKQKEYLGKMLGRTFEVLIEHRKKGIYQALTPNYCRFFISAKTNPEIKQNEFIQIRAENIIEKENSLGLEGEVIKIKDAR